MLKTDSHRVCIFVQRRICVACNSLNVELVILYFACFTLKTTPTVFVFHMSLIVGITSPNTRVGMYVYNIEIHEVR